MNPVLSHHPLPHRYSFDEGASEAMIQCGGAIPTYLKSWQQMDQMIDDAIAFYR